MGRMDYTGKSEKKVDDLGVPPFWEHIKLI